MTKRSPYDLTRLNEDTANLPVFELLEFYYRSGYKVLITSGRSDSFKLETIDWLVDKFKNHTTLKDKEIFDIISQLFMRKTGDSRKDWIIKREIFMEHFDQQYNVQMIFDDRERVLWMWQDLGLFVFNVNQKENF